MLNGVYPRLGATSSNIAKPLLNSQPPLRLALPWYPCQLFAVKFPHIVIPKHLWVLLIT